MASLEYRAVSKRFDASAPALAAFSLAVSDGELVVLVGPSGCGKSTALRLLAGLESPTEGELLIGAEVVNARPPQARNVAMVFQDYALYPHMSVRRNLEFPLRMRRTARAARARRVAEVARLLDLEALLERRPAQLSGGQRQRVAMGRALVREPAVFLMDEPLSNLDAALRGQIRAEIAALQRRVGVTTLYVTHDQHESMTLGDRVAVLCAGRLQQVGAPEAIYARPANTFVAGFIGSPGMNLVPARPAGGGALALGAEADPALVALRFAPPGAAGTLTLGVRPEHVALAARPGAGPGLALAVRAVESLGHERLVHLAGHGLRLVARTPAAGPAPAAGEALWAALDPRHLHLFGADGAALGAPGLSAPPGPAPAPP